MYVYVYVYMYICIYIYIYTHIDVTNSAVQGAAKADRSLPLLSRTPSYVYT